MTIVGTGSMARGIAARALAGGHHVAFPAPHPSHTQELADAARKR